MTTKLGARYGHFEIEKQRAALDPIGRTRALDVSLEGVPGILPGIGNRLLRPSR